MGWECQVPRNSPGSKGPLQLEKWLLAYLPKMLRAGKGCGRLNSGSLAHRYQERVSRSPLGFLPASKSLFLLNTSRQTPAEPWTLRWTPGHDGTRVHFSLESLWLVSCAVRRRRLLGRTVCSWKVLESKDTSCGLADFSGGLGESFDDLWKGGTPSPPPTEAQRSLLSVS